MKSRVLSPDVAALLEKLEHKLGVLLRATDQAGTAADGVLWATPELPATKELQGVRKALLSMGERARDRSGCAKHAANDAMALLADLLSVLEADLSRHNKTVRQVALEHDLAGTALCPYRFSCAAVANEVRFHSGDATEGTEISIRLADALMDARGEERTNARLNEILNEARTQYRAGAAFKARQQVVGSDAL